MTWIQFITCFDGWLQSGDSVKIDSLVQFVACLVIGLQFMTCLVTGLHFITCFNGWLQSCDRVTVY